MAGLEIGVVPSGVDERCFDVSGLSLRFLRKGSGPALVYLHDSLGSVGWLPLFDDLASGFDVVPDALYQLWDLSTEMTARVCWKPWMFSLELPSLLAGVTAPTAVVWGADDQLFPLDIGHQYVERLPDARLHLVADAGHWVELEQPEALAEITRGLR